MRSIEWIDMLIETQKLPSDRQAALLIGMTAQSMSGHRKGKVVTLDDKFAYRLEELLKLPHGTIVADQHAEREKDPAIAAMWQRLGKLAGAVASFALVAAIAGAPQSDAFSAKKVADVENPRVGGSIPSLGTIS